jgi:GntR family transcriptional regulator
VTIALAVDVTAATPVYEQLRAQIAGHIGTGSLRIGDRLPTVRSLAAELSIAVNTVGRAYSELEAAGLIRTGRRAGTTVIGPAIQLPGDDLLAAAAAFAVMAVTSSISDDAAIAMVRHALQQAQAPSG